MLEKYQSKGIPLGICTNKQEASSLRLLDELDLGRYFTFVAGGDTFLMHKPHPDHVRGVMEKLGVTKDNCAMVGDGPNDVIAAHSAGVRCIVVTHGYSEDYNMLGADKLIADFGELPAALSALGFELV
jgi:phosphoglycolate phosphatase